MIMMPLNKSFLCQSMTKSKKPRKKREPSLRVKVRRDLVAERKALRAKIRELLKKAKGKDRDISSLSNAKKRS